MDIKKEENKSVYFEIKQYFDFLPEALLKGITYPPGITINGKKFIQEVVPDKNKLREAVLSEMKS